MFRKGFIAFLAFVFLTSLSTLAVAQVTGGAVTGTVTDANGAVVPNVTIKLTNNARGNDLTTQTTDAGSYIFPNVQVGEYKITVEQTGFAPATQEVKVALNQTTTVDVILQTAGVGATVEVTTASDAIVQLDSSQLGKSFETRKVLDLPIAGNPNNLALLAPNVVTRTAGVQGSGGTVGGVRPRGNTFNIDGVDNNDASVTGDATRVIQDAVEEFTLLQNNFNAEFGAGAGGQFNTITKSGTNNFNGSAFLYYDDDKFNAPTTSESQLGEKNPLKQSRYGFTLGGPFVKNKLFFFGAYERTFFEEAASPGTYFAPTAAGLNQIATLPGVSPFVVNFLRDNLTLAPNASATATAGFGTVLGVSGIPFGEVIVPTPASNSANAFQINIDHLPNDRNQFRYRFAYDRQRAEAAGGGGTKFNNLVTFDSRLFSANWIRTISSNVVNDLRLSYRSAINDFPLKDESLNNFPNITVLSLNLALGPNGVLPQGTPVDNNYQIYDALTYNRGNHTFKFGAEMRRLIFTSIFLPRARGDYFYSNFDRLLRDLSPNAQNLRGVGNGAYEGDRFQFFFFGQDDWKVRPNLTLNLGLRYEYSNLPKGSALQELNQISSIPGVIEFNRPKTDKNNFAPRVGFAYSPNWDNSIGRFLFGNQGDSSIRANFAISHFVNFQNLLLLGPPPQVQQELFNAGSATAFLQNGGAPNTPLPFTTPAQARAATSNLIADQTVPYSISFTLSYQRQIARDTGIELRYLGTRVRKLPVQVRLNAAEVNLQDLSLPTFTSQPTAAQLAGLSSLGTIINNSPTALVGRLEQYGFGGVVTSFSPIGKSQYDGVSASLTRRLTKGFGLTAAYTFSKTLDNSTNELNSSALNPRRAQDGFNIDDEFGLSALDVPHRFVVSFNYDVPFFNNDENSFLRAFLGGWQVNGIFQAQSGAPVTIRSGIDSNLNLDSAGDRAIFNPNGTPGTSSRVCPIDSQGRFLIAGSGFLAPGTPTTDINLCSLGFYGPSNAVAYVAVTPNAQFIQAGFGAMPTVGRNTFRTRGFNSTDVVLLKNTRFGTDGRFNFQIGAEIFDLFNQRQKTIVGVGAQTAAFSIAGNANFNNYEIGEFTGRTVTLRAKFIF